ncbi:14-3-3 protein [Trametopsis cervina]|nr:14-3-3 protein [Trametopsis cervina]
MPSAEVTISRLDKLYLAKVADQAERYRDVVTSIKSLITSPDEQLTVEERNLLSIAFKNLTAQLRNQWRTIDTLEKKTASRSAPQQVALMHLQKERIRRELDSACMEIVELLEKYLIPSASAGEEKVFYSKMRGDYYRYLAEFTKDQPDDKNASSSLDAYKFAYKHALTTLDPTHPTRLGLALNFAVFYHDIWDSPERACYLAKHAFDEAIAAASEMSAGQALEDSLTILQLLRDDMLLWKGEIQ